MISVTQKGGKTTQTSLGHVLKIDEKKNYNFD